MKRLKLLSGAAAAALATAGLFAGPITHAGAVTTDGCKLGQFPVSEAAASNLRVGCAASPLAPGDFMDAIKISDFTNATWHDGASRLVKVTATSAGTAGVACNTPGPPAGCVLSVTSGVVGIAGTNNDLNRSVEAGFNKLQPGSFIIGEAGTGPGGSITLNQPVLKTGNYSLLIENGPGRATLDATLTGTSTITSPTANFQNGGASSDVGKSISGTGIPLGATITSVGSSTSVSISPSVTVDETAGSGCDTGGNLCGINIAEATRNSTQRMVTDLSVNGSTIYSNSANFQTTDIGLLVKGTGLPANAYITATDPGHLQATLSAPATKAAAGIITTIGLASATAPVKDGVDPVATLQTEIVLNPALVAGSPDCSQNFAAGLDIIGVWNSPSKFAVKKGATDPANYFNDSYIGLSNHANQAFNPLSTKPIIAQIQFKTPTVQFAGYVQESSSGNTDIVFPFVPTALGQCPSTSIASVFTFDADMQSQTLAPSGYGKAGSGGFRHNLGLSGTSPTATSTQSATYQGYETGQSAITGITMTTSKQIPASTFTKASNGLVEGQVVTLNCGLTCTADGLKAATAYYVHLTGASTFQLSLTPFDLAHGGTFTAVAPKTSVDTVEADFLTFATIGSSFTNSCTVSRTAPMDSDGTGPTDAFPCSAG